MSIFLILLAAGDSKRLKSSTPKPYHMINNKTLLEHSFYSFSNFAEIKKTVLVFNKKHKKFIDKLSLKNNLKVKLSLANRIVLAFIVCFMHLLT